MGVWVDAESSRVASVLTAAALAGDAFYAETAALPETPNGVTLLIDGATRVCASRTTVPARCSTSSR